MIVSEVRRRGVGTGRLPATGQASGRWRLPREFPGCGRHVHTADTDAVFVRQPVRCPLELAVCQTKIRHSEWAQRTHDQDHHPQSQRVLGRGIQRPKHPRAPIVTDGNMRLVGLSQPFFVPSRAENINDYGRRIKRTRRLDPAARPTKRPACSAPSSNTPAHDAGHEGQHTRRHEVPAASGHIDRPSDSEEKPGPAMSIVSEEDSERNVTDGEEEEEEKTICVLVVEGNQINQKLVVKVLQLEKVQEISVAEDGLQAVDKVKEAMAKDRKFDIIFMDIQVLSSRLPMVLC